MCIHEWCVSAYTGTQTQKHTICVHVCTMYIRTCTVSFAYYMCACMCMCVCVCVCTCVCMIGDNNTTGSIYPARPVVGEEDLSRTIEGAHVNQHLRESQLHSLRSPGQLQY